MTYLRALPTLEPSSRAAFRSPSPQQACYSACSTECVSGQLAGELRKGQITVDAQLPLLSRHCT